MTHDSVQIKCAGQMLPCQCACRLLIDLQNELNRKIFCLLQKPFPASHLEARHVFDRRTFPGAPDPLIGIINIFSCIGIHGTGMEEAFKYLVGPKPHHRWQAKLNSQKQNTGGEKSLFGNIRQHGDGNNNPDVVDPGRLLSILHGDIVLENYLRLDTLAQKMCLCGYNEY